MANFKLSPPYGILVRELEARKKAVLIEFRYAGTDQERQQCQVRLLALEEVPGIIDSIISRGAMESLNQLTGEEEEESE